MTVFAPGYSFEAFPQGRKSLTIEQQIDAFRVSWMDWHLNIARELSQSNPNAGFAVLSIVNPFFEMFARHYEGKTSKEARKKGQSEILGKKGIDLVFPGLDKQLPGTSKLLYESLRCSIAHMGLTGKKIMLTDEIDEPLVIKVDEQNQSELLIIRPALWVTATEIYLSKYVEKLRDPKEFQLRKNFSRCFLSSQ